MEWNNIYHIDVLKGLKKLQNDSVDVIICDPPYNIGKNYGNNTKNDSMEEYIKWTKKWFKECYRVLGDNGTMYIYGFSEILAHISVLHSYKEQRWLIWSYKNKAVHSLNFWQRSHESILVIWKKKPIFNKDDVRIPYSESFLKNAAGKVRISTEGRFSNGKQATIYKAHEKGALPRDVIEISALAGGAGSKERYSYCKDCDELIYPKDKKLHLDHNVILHPTQKPMKLTKKLIEASINKDKVNNILIPFSGSGSESVVIKTLGHNYLGFDMNEDYVRLAKGWLNETKKED